MARRIDPKQPPIPVAPDTNGLGGNPWEAAYSISRSADALQVRDYGLPLILEKRLCDALDDEIAPHSKVGVQWS